MKLIDKDALVAEIYKLKKSHDNWSCMGKSFHRDYETLLSFIDTIDMKEVDLEKELDSMITPELKFHKALPSLFDVAKHFFELGLKVQKGEEV